MPFVTWASSGLILPKTKSAPFICTPFTFCVPVPTLIVLSALPLSVALTSDCWLTPSKSKLTLIVSKVPLKLFCLFLKSNVRSFLDGSPLTVNRPVPWTCCANSLSVLVLYCMMLLLLITKVSVPLGKTSFKVNLLLLFKLICSIFLIVSALFTV